ncbi:hypothetical protein GQ43DRAFT_439594 [Delitschia confertaspora ATCC 74209]|uniref:Uncharacterized protein n=1 Tax=Delitschia confertaspora ATCC 74209 TaxID=1513339 RepID=A0A9P4JNC6_9PLEO|nr:hypothetical protein GQ43DRAFT_439594 [Delitschia confertaspora ATCC 74209]
MGFEGEELDSTIIFDEHHNNIVTMVIGKGRIVYWKNCRVTVYEKDNQGNCHGVAQEKVNRYIDYPSS